MSDDDPFAVIPNDKEAYKSQEYWESRYAAQPTAAFDWFKSYAQIQPLLAALIPSRDARILNLGSGNSTLAEDLYDDGYTQVMSVDFSETVVRQMRERHSASRPSLDWRVMDIRQLDLPDASFDVAIDKGTMDALMCERGDVWDPSEELCREVAREVDEVARVLRPGGKFVYITFGQPHFRRRHLERPGVWDVTVHTIGDAFHYYCYVMEKPCNGNPRP